MQDEKAKFRIPTLVEGLQQEEVHRICERVRDQYQLHWRDLQPETHEELEALNQLANEQMLAYFQRECKYCGLPASVMEWGREQVLHTTLQSCFLLPQEQLRSRINARLLELKQIAEQDETKQAQLEEQTTGIQQQLHCINHEITRYQQIASKAKEDLQMALTEKAKAEAQYHNAQTGSGSRHPCIIL